MAFDVAASSYDRFMGRYSTQLAPQLADLAGIESGARVLDVGCGPGALTAELIRRVGERDVAAVDPSASFVAAARERHPGVDVRIASAEELPFEDGAFGAALAQLVVHFMTDPVAGLREMARVTVSDGVIAACVWDHAGARSPIAVYWDAARDVTTEVVDESALAGARQGHLRELFEASGLVSVIDTEIEASARYTSFDEWWEPFTLGVGPAGGHFQMLDEATRTRVRERCAELLPSPPFELHTVAWAARGIASPPVAR